MKDSLVFHFRFFFSSRRRHTRSLCDWSSDVCSSDLIGDIVFADRAAHRVYFSDLTNAQVDAWDTRNGVFLGAIRGTFTGLRGFPATLNNLGPVGVLADNQGQVWAGNGDGSVVVGSARTLTETDSIATGGV